MRKQAAARQPVLIFLLCCFYLAGYAEGVTAAQTRRISGGICKRSGISMPVPQRSHRMLCARQDDSATALPETADSLLRKQPASRQRGASL